MSAPRSICIVTCDIVGPIRNGGIGSAYHSLALTLARAGHRVTVLYALGSYCESRNIEHWQAEYAREHIELVPLPAELTANVKGHPALKMSVGVYEWLKTRRFDIVHCHEWRGLAYFTAQAKRQGLCLHDAVLCIGTHSPTLWHLAGMNELATPEDLEVDFMERGSVALADILWSPSRYMVHWLKREGWRLPAQVLVLPNLATDLAQAEPTNGAPSELVFFGRLETRKGLDLFCDALDRLVAAGLTPERVTFLGKNSTIAGQPSTEYLEKRGGQWPFPWRIESTLARDAAMEYLRAPGRLAVLPSRLDNLPYTVIECLGSRIPFVACATGGIPELVKRGDRARALCAPAPAALADLLARALTEGHQPVTPASPPSRTTRTFLKWHTDARLRRIIRPDRVAQQPPLVSVCITHHNRPAFLSAAIESVRQQDYPFVEIVLVDDGSSTPEAKAGIDALQPEFDRRGWTIVRQTNRYLGAARNAAIAASTGRYVLFMDDDNLAMPHEVSTFVRAAETSGAGILTCFLQVFQDASPTPKPGPTHVWPFLGAALGPGLLRNAYGDANAFVRREILQKIGGFTEDVGVGCEDWEFFARAVLSGVRLEVVPEPLVRYRQAPTSMLSTTSAHANRMRALRPYLALLPSHLRSLVHLSGRTAPVAAPAQAAEPARLDHVQNAVVFGSGEAGRLAIDLAGRCGWSVPWIVDNNASMWDSNAHGRPVKSPASLTHGGFDLVIVASAAGKSAISAQLSRLGLTEGREFVHFLDPVQIGPFTTQVRL